MKKLILFIFLIPLSIGMFAQIDTLTNAQWSIANGSRVLRHRLNAVIVQTNENTSDILSIEGMTAGEVASQISDSIQALLTGGELGIAASDTMLFFSWTVGAGNVSDTTLFSLNDVIAGAKWEGSYSLVITKVTAVVSGSTPDIDIALLHDANFRDATPTAVLSADLTVTSTTTGNEATSFSSATIASGQWLWVRIDQQTAQPTQCVVNIYGYLTE